MPARLGKLAPRQLEATVLPHLGASRAEVLIGPGTGIDAAIIHLSAGRVLAVTSDPLSFIPALGPATSARLACHLVASDLWTTGIPPAYASVSFHLPPAFEDATLEAFVTSMDATWRELEIATVTGHTGRYAGLDSTLIGAATLIGVGDEGRYLSPKMASSGDRVIVTGGCAIEATAIAAHLMPERLGSQLKPEVVARARSWIERVTVVPECRALIGIGVRERGVTSMHDATEGGVLGGLLELARASTHDLRIERSKIPISEEARGACAAWGGIDPYWTLSEGTLIATVRPEHRDAALNALQSIGTVAADVGELVNGRGRLWLTEPDGRVVTLDEPEPDPYWAAYDRATREGWK